jgi:TonB family protein
MVMMRIILLVALTLTTTMTGFAQDTDNDAPAATTGGASKPQPTVDVNTYIAENASLPASRSGKKETLRVMVKFTVDEQGEVGEVKLTKTSGNPQLDDEAIRVVESMPRWKPAMSKGKPVKVYHTLPLKFTLEPENADEKEERMAEKRDKKQEDKEEREERTREKKDKRDSEKEED